MLNLRKKLLVSIFTLMLALVAVSTTTYAWFTMGTSVDVDGIHMEVEGVDGLFVRLVSVNGIDSTDAEVNTFKAHVNLSSAITGIKMKPLTNVEEESVRVLKNIGFDSTKKTWLPQGSSVGIGTAVSKNINYIHIELEFYSASKLNVYLQSLKAALPMVDDGEGNMVVKPHSFTTPVDVKGEGTISDVLAGQAVTEARLANALRIAYSGVPATSVEPGQTGVVNRTYNDAEINRIAQTIIHPDVYDATPAKQYGYWAGASWAYYNAISDFPLDEAYKEDKYVYGISQQENTEKINGSKEYYDSDILVTLTGSDANGYYGTVTFTIWLEGYDADCFNAVINDTADIAMSFKGAKAN